MISNCILLLDIPFPSFPFDLYERRLGKKGMFEERGPSKGQLHLHMQVQKLVERRKTQMKDEFKVNMKTRPYCFKPMALLKPKCSTPFIFKEQVDIKLMEK